MIEPLRLSFDVDCPAEHAFDMWTAKISLWWPPDHTVSGAHAVPDIVLEPRVGGRIFERADGVEHEWGEITIWEPPRRLGYLWHLNTDRSDATEVEILFTGNRDATTRVDIEHRGWERLGVRGPGWREANQGGWRGLLPHYVAACSGDSSPRP